ncbi:MAG TPA: galactokinase [Lachnospiraceae bacterium]|nr:GHMP kinase [Lachnospiraceae bacterium]MBQ9567358.1 GHMP kinase [Lachnospiraceae bacterium]MCR4785883.1 GHMP kinase [Lachnospiraceae bacterium]HAL32237.1 galactokinase [Lachnospiraceae bacterium]HBB59652.1 galactokinase [Lachnospiraceae bacterium]
MIIVRSPLRISLGGGGTDLPSYYEENEGFLLTAAINKFVYITMHENFMDEILVKYSKTENVRDVNDIRHPIFRECIKMLGLQDESFEIQSMADIPAGTGLGSSSSFTTALLKCLHEYKGELVGTEELAREACEIEMVRLKEPIGKQDQYIAAYGGIRAMWFHKDGSVTVEPVNMSRETLYNLEDNLVLYFTGFERSASQILKEQDDRTKASDSDMKSNLDMVKQMGLDTKQVFEKGDLRAFADIMNHHWEIKKKRSGQMSNPRIDEWYEYAMKHGALGGKLIGAGGGGFLMFYAEDKVGLREAMKSTGMKEVRFRFEKQGTRLVY